VPINSSTYAGTDVSNHMTGAAVASSLGHNHHEYQLVSNIDVMLAQNIATPFDPSLTLETSSITQVFDLPVGSGVPGFIGQVGDYNESWWSDAQAADCATITITDIETGDFLHAGISEFDDPIDLMPLGGTGAIQAAGYQYLYRLRMQAVNPTTTAIGTQHQADYGSSPHFGNLNQLAITGNTEGYDIQINWGPESCFGGDPGGGTEIYIEYVSNANYSHYHDATKASYGVDATEKPFIPMVHILASEALRSFIAYKSVSMLDSTNRKTNIQDISRARTNYYNQKRLARARLMKFNQEEAITAGRKAFKQSPKI
jgi:hypothetical protein